MTSEELRHITQQHLEDMKTTDIVYLDVSQRPGLFDQMMIATGRSDRHVCAVAEHLATALKHAGLSYVRTEGLEQGAEWVLVDIGTLIVHIMTTNARDYYQLEALWGTPHAPSSPLEANTLTPPTPST